MKFVLPRKDLSGVLESEAIPKKEQSRNPDLPQPFTDEGVFVSKGCTNKENDAAQALCCLGPSTFSGDLVGPATKKLQGEHSTHDDVTDDEKVQGRNSTCEEVTDEEDADECNGQDAKTVAPNKDSDTVMDCSTVDKGGGPRVTFAMKNWTTLTLAKFLRKL